MTDFSSTFAGKYRAGILPITCILNEGAPTVVRAYDQAGYWQQTLTWASELYENDVVAIANDADVTFVATDGTAVLEKAVDSESLVVGRIVSLPKINKFPVQTSDASSLALRLAGGYFRTANIEFFAFDQVLKATVMADGTHPTLPGVGATLKFNMTSSYSKHSLCFDSAASGGVGVVPFHYVPAGVDGDLYSCLVGLNGPLASVTGA